MKVRRRSRRSTSAVAMVEFALVGPLFFLLLLGIIILAFIVTHQITLSNAVRDTARAAAVCGSQAANGTTLPDGTSCSGLQSYLDTRVSQVDTSLTGQGTFTVFSSGNACQMTTSTVIAAIPPGCTLNSSATTVIANCEAGVAANGSPQAPYTVEISIQYNQPLYFPFLGFFFGDSNTNTRNITATGDATCEQ